MEEEKKEKKFYFLCYHVLREERKSLSRYRPGLLGNRRVGSERKSRAQVGSGYLMPGLVSVSDALIIGVLTLNYCSPVKSRKQRGEGPRKSGARLEFLMHH